MLRSRSRRFHDVTHRSAANQNTLLSSFVVLVILFTAMVMAAGTPQSFATPEDGVKAFVAAVRANDKAALANILGTDAAWSGDAAQDRNGTAAFLAAYDAHWDIARKGAALAMLNVGPREWTLPIPLVRNAGAWHFDTSSAGGLVWPTSGK